MPNTFQGLLSFPEFSGNDLDSAGRSELVFQFHTILNNLSIQLCCPICQDVPTQPYLLPTCGHTFCYSCIKHWFQCNPSCPICRSIIGETKPILNHSVKNIIVALIDDLSQTAKELHLKDYKSYKQKLESWEREKNEEFSVDKANDFPWLKKIASNWGRAVVDTEDGVPRCSACHWELVDGHCENCGRTMVGWQDRTDGDELDDDDDDEEDEDEFGRGPRRDRALHSDSDDWEDYDNGLNDMRGRIVDNEAEESDGGEEDGDGTEDNDAYRRRSHNERRDHHHGDETGYVDAYDSDDGFVVDDDEEKEEEDNDDDNESGDNEYVNTSDVEIVDEDKFASGDEDVILNANAAEPVYLSDDESDGGLINPRRSRALLPSDDDDVSEEEEDIEVHGGDSDDDDDVDDDLLKTVKSGRKKAILDDEDEDDDDDDNNDGAAGDDLSSDDLIPSRSHSSRHKKKKRRTA